MYMIVGLSTVSGSPIHKDSFWRDQCCDRVHEAAVCGTGIPCQSAGGESSDSSASDSVPANAPGQAAGYLCPLHGRPGQSSRLWPRVALAVLVI